MTFWYYRKPPCAGVQFSGRSIIIDFTGWVPLGTREGWVTYEKFFIVPALGWSVRYGKLRKL